jgi:twitching motility two-component system response regulator PilH
MAISTVLVVEDSLVESMNLVSIIRGVGCTTVVAHNGADAVRLAKTHKPDLIFMDIVMEGVDGFEACRQINSDAEIGKTPIVFVTSKDQPADKVWGELQGAKAYITKPYSADEIVSTLKRF